MGVIEVRQQLLHDENGVSAVDIEGHGQRPRINFFSSILDGKIVVRHVTIDSTRAGRGNDEYTRIEWNDICWARAYVIRSCRFHHNGVQLYPPITYYWTVPLILDPSYLVGKLTSSKIAHTKGSGF
jgi:hypothetical protein